MKRNIDGEVEAIDNIDGAVKRLVETARLIAIDLKVIPHPNDPNSQEGASFIHGRYKTVMSEIETFAQEISREKERYHDFQQDYHNFKSKTGIWKKLG